MSGIDRKGVSAWLYNMGYERLANMIMDEKRFPDVNSEIIHCRDCKHYNVGFECLIEGYGIERDKDWYCADAERRTYEL